MPDDGNHTTLQLLEFTVPGMSHTGFVLPLTQVLEIGDDGFGGTAAWIDSDDDGEADLVALLHSSSVTTIRLPAVLSEGCC